MNFYHSSKITVNGNTTESLESLVRENIRKMFELEYDYSPNETDNKSEKPPEYSKKHIFKQELKEKYYKQKTLKFKIGERYVIKSKNILGLRFEKRIFEVKQIIWTLNDKTDVSSVIVKQVAGKNMSHSFLNEKECKMLHVAYEPGLQIMSMYLNWAIYKPQKH